MTFTATLSLGEAGARAIAAALGNDPLFEAQGIDVAEVAPGKWQVIVYFEERPDRSTAKHLSEVAEAEAGGKTRPFLIDALPDTDWVAKSLAGLAPVRAGRFLVHGRHDRDRRRANDIAIEIEAGQAFGTGHHGSTTGCLLAIERLAKSRRVANALDVGTGSGVLAIAIARISHAKVLASDIDPIAVAVARENFRLNGVGAAVEAIVAPGLGAHIFLARSPFDLVVANIFAGPLVTLAPAIRRLMARGGAVILSGLLIGQRARIVATYRGQGLRLIGDIRRGEWLTMMFERPM
jgi:ribosomal protein L11 methyltransferase